ncbi:MAG: hypothetical protein HY866_08380 [Chloroflexi bacterium]|nr:hypothetical protein [Chloroflexota bacterium]
MNDMSMEELRGKVSAVLPIMLIVLLVLGNIGLGAALLGPAWLEYNDLSSQVNARQQALDNSITNQQGNAEVIELQLTRAETSMTEAGRVFLSGAEADSILNNLYGYASSVGVEITDLQLQAPPEGEADNENSDLYDVRTFRLQIEGGIPQIVGFMALFQEASVPAVALKNLNLTQGETRDILTMDMLLYTSPYAPGDVLESLPAVIRPAPMPTPFPTPTPLRPTPTATMAPSPTPVPPTLVPPTPTISGPVVSLGTYDDNHSAIRYTAGLWETIESLSGYGGGYHYSQDANAEMEFVFVGTDVVVQYVAFTNFGIFEVYVDGILRGEADSYAAEGTFGQVFRVGGLPHNIHTLTLRNTARRNPSSEGTVIAIDAIHVLQPSLPDPTPPGGD